MLRSHAIAKGTHCGGWLGRDDGELTKVETHKDVKWLTRVNTGMLGSEDGVSWKLDQLVHRGGMPSLANSLDVVIVAGIWSLPAPVMQ